ncbi:MAG: hypothetical protein WDW38_006682 [Sanguina aurantia]
MAAGAAAAENLFIPYEVLNSIFNSSSVTADVSARAVSKSVCTFIDDEQQVFNLQTTAEAVDSVSLVRLKHSLTKKPLVKSINIRSPDTFPIGYDPTSNASRLDLDAVILGATNTANPAKVSLPTRLATHDSPQSISHHASLVRSILDYTYAALTHLYLDTDGAEIAISRFGRFDLLQRVDIVGGLDTSGIIPAAAAAAAAVPAPPFFPALRALSCSQACSYQNLAPLLPPTLTALRLNVQGESLACLAGITQLRELYLTASQATSLQPLAGHSNLQKLCVSTQNIAQFSNGIWGTLAGLKSLSVATPILDSPLEFLSFGGLSLTRLQISGLPPNTLVLAFWPNELEILVLPGLDQTYTMHLIGELLSLRSLDLQGSSGIDGDAVEEWRCSSTKLVGLAKLTALNLSRSSRPKRANIQLLLESRPSLRVLDVSGCADLEDLGRGVWVEDAETDMHPLFTSGY